ncbi:hypothetical protein [Sphingomonas sp. J315]|nr:hypothetical protein [Sphingomonas sp. J315]
MHSPRRTSKHSDVRFWSRLRTQSVGLLLIAVVLPMAMALLALPP